MTDSEPPPRSEPMPNPETVKAAIPVLQAELGLASSNLDAIDRKAGLLPPVLIALAGLLLPDGSWSTAQVVLILVALAAGIWSTWLVLRVVLPGEVSLGPNAEQIKGGLTMPQPDFELRVAASLVGSVEFSSRTSAVKARNLRRATYWAGAAILFLIAAQVAGGLSLTDQSNPAGATPSPSAAPATAPASPSLAPSAAPAPTAAPTPTPGPSTTEVGPTTGQVALPDFGQQVMERGGMPDFGQQLAAKGGPIPPAIEKRIIEKGG